MATRMKAPAQAAPVPQSKDDCAAAIRHLGDLQRIYERERADLNDLVAAATADRQPTLQALTDQMEALRTGIQMWCEARRVELCGEGDRHGKTVNLVTGDVAWRQRPPSVSVRGNDAAVDTLHRLGLGRFVRTKAEVDKAAILAEPDAVRGVQGITVVTGLEDFVITPFEVASEVAA
jgi:phage host-nuclease inhibitor protein Gam